MSDNHFNSALDEFDNLFAPPAQSDESNDIFSSSSFEVEDNQIFSSFAPGKQNESVDAPVSYEDVPTVNRVRQEIYYDDINKIYESISEEDTKKKRKKKKHHTLRNFFIILLCLAILGAGVWVYRNHSATVIDLFYTVKDYVLILIAKIKELIQQP